MASALLNYLFAEIRKRRGEEREEAGMRAAYRCSQKFVLIILLHARFRAWFARFSICPGGERRGEGEEGASSIEHQALTSHASKNKNSLPKPALSILLQATSKHIVIHATS